MTSIERGRELVNEQKKLVDLINTLEYKFKKDPHKRRTSESILTKLSSLEFYCRDFNANHAKILESGLNEGEYFEKSVFEQMNERYVYIKNLFLGYKYLTPNPALTEEQTDEEASKTLAELDTKEKIFELMNEQRSNIKAFERAISNLNIDGVSEKWQLEDELKTLTMRWENVDKLYWKLESMQSMEGYEEHYNELERKYKSVKERINRKIMSHLHQQKSAPKIELPYFNGSYEHWTTFKDLFTEIVHSNPQISNAQKMQHLKSKLRGEAERLVQHLQISSDNYTTCWEILNHRYDNIRLLFSYQANLLLNQPAIQQPTAALIKKMHDTTLECVNAITNLGVDTATWDPLIVHILVQKLDSETSTSYIESLTAPRDLPNLHDFLTYLETKFLALESSTKSSRNNTFKNAPKVQEPTSTTQFNRKPYFTQQRKTFERYPTNNRTFHTTVRSCPNCKKNHGLYQCPEFLESTPETRLRTVERLKVCHNCLFSHNGNECTSKKTCKHCNFSHNSLLHEAVQKFTPSTSKSRFNTHVSSDDLDEVLLATVQLKVESADGSHVTLRALLDQGSQLTLITENAVQHLNLKKKKCDGVVSGLGATTSQANKCKGEVTLMCRSVNNNYKFETRALVMSKLTNKLPNCEFNKQSWSHLENLKLADPTFNIPGDIDILLGADVYSEIIMEGLIRGKNTNIIAQQTQLGWIVCGKIKTFNCHVVMNDTTDLVKFWEQEELSNKQTNIEPDDACEKLYQETTTRLTDGRYQVRMPMKSGFQDKLGDSKPQAIAVFKQLEKRMEKNADFAREYKKFMKEYIDMGHMKKSEKHNIEHFLPHHGVIRTESVTTKLRVVFNASAKTNSGLSLNDLMESGPNLQADLQTLLLQWRKYKYAFTADLEKMFRFIALHPEDQQLLKIMWRNSPTEPITPYQLCTVTYGTKAAPYLAQKTLKQLALDEGDKYPIAKPILQNNFYMDDVLFCCESKEKARIARDELIKLLRCGSFNLRKWASNENELVADLAEDMRNPCNFNFTDNETSKTLGLGWNPKNDNFVFSSPLKDSKTKKHTKRQLLSEMAKLFDVAGWLSPITVKIKLLFQKVWLESLHWDEELPEAINKEWEAMRQDLENIQHIKLPRWLGFDHTNTEAELHAFSDASEKAYSAVVYSIVRSLNGETRVNIVAAKTKVAPIKNKTTLPRLELCGALLASQLLRKIIDIYDVSENMKYYAWTDSMVVLGWLHGDEKRWNQYVASRVSEIKKNVKPELWGHVKSQQNPADCASRGLTPTQLAQFPLWWRQGPEWLCNKEMRPETLTKHKFETNQEMKKQILTVQTNNNEPTIISSLLNKYSSIIKTVRVIAWVSRFITNARGVDVTKQSHLTLKETHSALIRIVKDVQKECYGSEIEDLRSKGQVNNKSNILKLDPKLDNDGILRVGGRLKNSQLSSDSKNPMILPQNHRLTELLINQAHAATLHGGARLTQMYLRQRYWIVGGNNTVKKQLRRCVKCIRFTTNKQTQLMSDLPKVRVTPARPFYNCGVDFAGPVGIKANKGRGIKVCLGYIAVFICMVTKAVHLELVSDLTSQTFILALKRMIARRGTPKTIFSDNGTNFVGANKELKRQFRENRTFTDETLLRKSTELEIEWKFNAPSWPSAGGLWEAAVKSMKHHIKRVLGEQKLTFEEFTTLLTQVEACLNSRPLVALTESIDDLDYVLTPAHFLIGQPLTTLPEEDLTEERTLTKRWQLTTKMYQQFWKLWSSDYLTCLQTKSKWNKKTENLKEGEVVLIKEDNLPPTRWALARVQEVHPGQDKLVRVVSLKTQRGILKRPVTKLIKLPVEEQTKSNNIDTGNNDSPRRQKNNNNNKWSLVQYLCMFLSFMSIIQGSEQHSFAKISPLERERQVYYDHIGSCQNVHDRWKILTFYNMTTYWQGVSNIDQYVNHIDEICQRFDYKGVCNGIVTELKQEVEDLKHNNHLLQTQHLYNYRMKRGLINAVGQIAHSLFGVLDESFAEQYERDIENVKTNENHLLALLKNQTSVIESENTILQRNQNSMNRQFQLMTEHIKEADLQLKEVYRNSKESTLMIYFNSITLSVTIILTKLRRIQESFIDTLNNIHKGHIDSTVLSQEQILKQLSVIAAQLPKHLSLPVEDIFSDVCCS